MQYRKCVALFAALLVGFGVVAVDAASVSSVAIVSPADSGALRGIDSTFTVRAKILDFTPNDSLEVVFFLVTTSDSNVVADATGNSESFSYQGKSQASVIAIAGSNLNASGASIKNNTGTKANNASFASPGASGAWPANSAGGVVAARAKRVKAIASSTTFAGDGDSLRAVASGDTTTFTWYSRVHYTSSTVGGVRAAVYAIDGTSTTTLTDTTDPSLTAASLQLDLDADRPADPDQMIYTTSAEARGNKVNSPDHVVTGFTAAGNDRILGIGDTIKANVKLGTQTDGVLIGDTLTVVADVFGKTFAVSKTSRTADTLQFRQVIAEGDYGDLIGADDLNRTGTLGVFIVDKAGNRSGSSDGIARGVTLGLTYFVDAKKPILDGQYVSGDTILPVSNDTITDGSLHTGYSNDLSPITYNLPEALDTLFITLDGDGKTTLRINNTPASLTKSIADVGLLKSTTLTVDFTSVGNTGPNVNTDDSLVVANAGTSARIYNASHAITGDTLIKTGLKTITLQGQDLAGNLGSVLTRTNVYVDVDDITLERLFPTAASGLDTLEEETAKLVFKLSEHADSVMITYTGISGNDNGKTRTRPLVGSELTNTSTEQTITVDSLKSNTLYTLRLVAADLSGNYTRTAQDTFVYDTTFVVPVIAKFKITSSVTGPGTALAAGGAVTLTLKAQTVNDKAAVTYKEAAVLKVTGGRGVTLTGTGVTTTGLASGRANLSADDWIVGERLVTLTDTAAIDTLSIAIQDCTDTTKLYVGAFDSTLIVSPAVYSKVVLSAEDTVGQGDSFWVGVRLADKFGNTRNLDNRFVEVTTTALGVQVPNGAIAIKSGSGGFWANSQGYAGTLSLTVRDIIDTLQVAGVNANGNNFINGSLSVYVDGDGSMVLDAPDTLIAQDFMGASGMGDQGGFVLLTFDASDDHSTLTGYRIYREIAVDVGGDSDGLVDLNEPAKAMVPWGRVDPVPGEDIMRVVVATLDGDSTAYSVSAERGQLSAKEAFDGAESVATPYELMAQTMLNSKQVAQADLAAPVFATLTPEALAFSAQGVIPRLKVTDGTLLSSLRRTDSAVRAVDNLPPAAVTFVRAQDTQGDAGGSITVQWSKSIDDKMLMSTVPQAIGGTNTFTTAGVEGYNIYRKIGDGAWQMVGQAGAGETSFEDATVFNGVRYAYKVQPFDADNVTPATFEKSAMAIRNNVVDANGQRVNGLFGADNRVDYDDFFIFADHFGLGAGDELFDRAFDLRPNNAVDFDDFFAFADNFGREVVGAGKTVPTMSGLNSDARFYLAASGDLPRVGEELSVAVSLENFVEVRGYGLTVEYDNDLLEFVGSRVDNSILGESDLAVPQAIGTGDGQVHIAAFGQTVGEGDLGLSLIFRTRQEVEESYIELTSGALQDGSYGLNRITSPVSIRIETRPEVYALEDNYPNPFNPETTIKYQLPEAGQVRLEVYNMLGQVVRTLVDNQFQNAGRYTLQWDATNNGGQALSSGVYFYRILAGGAFQSHKKMLLLK